MSQSVAPFATLRSSHDCAPEGTAGDGLIRLKSEMVKPTTKVGTFRFVGFCFHRRSAIASGVSYGQTPAGEPVESQPVTGQSALVEQDVADP